MIIMSKVRFGILGPGKIAARFAHDLLLVEGAVLHAVASRDEQRAKDFAAKYKASTYYNDYQELLKDPIVDIVYVATPHVFHFPNTMMALNHGKAVICEKPLGINSREVQEMISLAKQKRLFLMEALWTRFLPATERLLALLSQGIIGEMEFLRADFGFLADNDPQNRIFNNALGGGSLMDIGIYPVYLSLLILGVPENIKATASFTTTNVDSFCGLLFEYANGKKAILESTTIANTPTEAIIYGKKGSIKLHKNFHHSRKITIDLYDSKAETIDVDYKGLGLVHEINEVIHCLQNQKIESLKMSHSMSIDLINTLDRIRQQIGLSFHSDLTPGNPQTGQ